MTKATPHRKMNIQRLGIEDSLWGDLYHRLLRLSWPRFFWLFLIVFCSVNSLFALGFHLAPGSVAHIEDGNFGYCFSFSVQTLTTIGYGYFYPVTPYAHFLVTVEAAIGMFFTATLTGLIFAKFARPSARIAFSQNLIWTRQDGVPVLALRLGNMRTNRVFGGRANMSILRDHQTSEGERLRKITDLKLVREETPVFALSWTILHVINENSPFYGKSFEKIQEEGGEIIVTFVGLDQEMAQSMVATTSYSIRDIIQARKFKDMISTSDGRYVIDFSKLHDVEL